MKSLEALESIKQIIRSKNDGYLNMFESFDFLVIERELKSVEIIKNKQVNVFIFLHSGNLETYNDMVEGNRKLTQEEYNLLSKVLFYE